MHRFARQPVAHRLRRRGLNRRTRAPTRTTTPATSWPKMSGRRYGRMRLNIEVRQYVGIREGIRRPGSRSACSEGVGVGFVRHGHEPLRVCSIQQFASIRRPAWDHEELETRAFVPLLLRHPPSWRMQSEGGSVIASALSPAHQYRQRKEAARCARECCPNAVQRPPFGSQRQPSSQLKTGRNLYDSGPFCNSRQP